MWRDRRHARPGLHRHAGARPRRRRALARRAEAAAGPRGAVRRGARLREGARRDPRPAAARLRHGRGRRRLVPQARALPVEGADFELADGHVVIAAITSCTNTSNPSVLIGAGPARQEGARDGPEAEAVGEDVARAGLAGGDRISREGRAAGASRRARLQPRRLRLHDLHRQFRAAAGGDLRGDQRERPRRLLGALRQSQFRGPRQSGRARELSRLAAARRRLCARRLAARSTSRASRSARTSDGKPVYLKDLWPSSAEIAALIRQVITRGDVPRPLRRRLQGRRALARRSRSRAASPISWSDGSTYVQNPPYFTGMKPTPEPLTDIDGARILGLFLDSITTDHISPAGSIKRDGPAGEYLDLAPGAAGRLQLLRRAARQPRGDDARHLRQHPHQEPDGAGRRRRRHHPLPVGRADVDLRRGDALRARRRCRSSSSPGKEYGTGSSRDWAAKGTRLLGVRAVIAQSFERIHRSNLVGMGVLPLVLEEGTSWQTPRPEGRRDGHASAASPT